MLVRRMSSQVDVKQGLQVVREQVERAFINRPASIRTAKPILVAASKTNSAAVVAEVYSTGHRHFGENYVQELVDKAIEPVILEHCPDIKWHLIGHLQSNKVNKVLKTPGLYMIETIDSVKLANTVNSAWEKIRKPEQGPLKVLVQVNTSAEDEKSGVEPEAVIGLYEHIIKSCANLKLEGLMTIGKYGHDYSTGPNMDLVRMMELHAQVCDSLKLAPEDVQVSMGMSNDFDRAIEMGSTMVRVGTSIFGYRPKKDTSAGGDKNSK